MSTRTRLVVLLVSTPLVLVAVVGGVVSRASAREASYQHLRVFEDVVDRIVSNYVEVVDTDRIMKGALHGLADGLDPDSAYLTPAQVAALQGRDAPARGGLGIELTRQYYLRVLAVRDGSPAARAGLRTGDFIRAINEVPTRDMSVFQGAALLAGTPGTTVKLTILRGNAAEPHAVDVVREAAGGPAVTARMVRPGTGLVRVAAFTDRTASDITEHTGALVRNGATALVIDLRNTATGPLPAAIAAARLFLAPGAVVTSYAVRGRDPQPTQAAAGDGAIQLPVTVLIDNGTSGAAEIFTAALAGNKRARVVGERTVGRVATQELVPLPDGSGLWLSTAWYLTPAGDTLHEKGLQPDVAVAEPEVEFGAAPPPGDPILEKALERPAEPAAP